MKLHYFFIFAVAVVAGAFSSCREKDDIPDISVQHVNKKFIQGGWRIFGNQVLWDLSAKGTSINNIYDFKSKINDRITEDTQCLSVYFANDTLVYFVRHLPTDPTPYFTKSNYVMTTDSSGFAIVFTEPSNLCFNAPIVYVKTIDNKNELTFYLRRNEVMHMIETNSESKSYASIIRNEVNNAEISLFAIRDTLDYYKDLDAYSGIIR